MDCVLRPWRAEDAADLAECLNNRKILDNLRDGLPFPYTVQDARNFINFCASADGSKAFVYAIAVEGGAVGSIGVYRQGNIHCRTAEMGYYLAEPYWGKGLATSAVRQACRQVFDTTDIVRIFAEPFARNAASCRVLEKCGFTLEGVLRQNAFKNGELLDMKLYSLLKGEGDRATG